MSETASTTTFNVSAAERKIYSVGKPIWGVSVQVWDSQGRPLPSGAEHVGEIVVRGPNVMTGYHNNPEATAQAFAGGWFHTGDLGYVNDDGYLFIVDRVAAYKYPRTVEFRDGLPKGATGKILKKELRPRIRSQPALADDPPPAVRPR